MKTKLIAFLLAVASLFSLFGVFSFAEDTAVNDPTADLWMKVGTEHAYISGVSTVCDTDSDTAMPYTSDGTVFFPLRALTAYLGLTFTVNGNTAEISDGKTLTCGASYAGYTSPVLTDGVVYIALDQAADLYSLNQYYHGTMGMLALSKGTLAYEDTYDSWTALCDIAEKFVFDYPDADKIIADMDSTVGLGTHPRLLADQNKFDLFAAIYAKDVSALSGDEVQLYPWIRGKVTTAQTLFTTNFKIDENGNVTFFSEEVENGFRQPYFCYDENGNVILPVRDKNGRYKRKSVPAKYNDGKTCTYVVNGNTVTYTHYDENGTPDYTSSCLYGDGYDEGGRLNESSKYTAYLQDFAFAWQVTREQKYADAFYLLAKKLGTWVCWGEGHYLNVADAAVWYAIGYDWIYPAFENEPEKLEELADILFKRGVTMGYASTEKYSAKDFTKVKDIMYISTGRKNSWNFYDRTNNWNTVCTSGMTMACLALLEKTDTRTIGTDTKTIREFCAETMADLFRTVHNCFYALAPDGSYMESPGYWSYGNNTLFLMEAALESSCGDDYGFMDAIGLDNTCYYAYYIGNAGNVIWNYHDGGRVRLDISSFYYISKHYGNSDFAYLRDCSHKNGGAPYDYMDILYYDSALSEGGREPTLSYEMAGIYTATLRSGWTNSDIFTGLHAGPSIVGHGDMDSGNIVLEMGGVRFLNDYGSENYNATGYFTTGYDIPFVQGETKLTRYRYFRKGVEAHNVIFLRSDELPYGQAFNRQTDAAFAKITRLSENGYGSLAVADMTPQYGSACTGAERALMITNSMQSVVLQDEVTFSSPTDLVWNLNINGNGVRVDSDGRTAYLSQNGKTLRLSLLSEDETLRFSFMNAGAEPLLAGTVTKNSAANQTKDGKIRESKASSAGPRLVIRADGCTEFKVAVVFELYTAVMVNKTVCYEMVPIADMVPVSHDNFPDPEPDPPKPTYDHVPSELIRLLNQSSATFGNLSPAEQIALLNKMYDIQANIDPTNATTKLAISNFAKFRETYAEVINSLNARIRAVEAARKAMLLPLG